MLKHVVRDWLSRVRDERDIDAALIAYLGADGFRDVHFTHGSSEIGKDFIAKRGDRDGALQYVIQSKAGDIATAQWRSVREQMWEAVRVGLPHPSFFTALPRQGVLALTGELGGGAKTQVDVFNEELRREGRLGIEVWHREELCRRFTDLDPTTVYPADKVGYAGFGGFYAAYGEALDGQFDARGFERHSRLWLAGSYLCGHLLLPAVEASVVAGAAESAGDFYGAFQARLSLVRAAADAAFASGVEEREFFEATVARAVDGASAAAERFCDDVWARREEVAEHKLIHVVQAAPMITYPVLCLRLCEALAFVYFASADAQTRATALGRLRKIVVTEEGVKHPIGDRYAVSVVAASRALLAGGHTDVVRCYLRETAFWVLNLYENRVGLSSVDDEEKDEVGRLFGPEVANMRPADRRDSFMVTAFLDLCAYAHFGNLYSDIENDVRALRLTPEYWSAPDTRAQFRVDSPDIVRFPNVAFQPTFASGEPFGYGQHLEVEPRSFTLAVRMGPVPHLAVSLLLRDRIFPAHGAHWKFHRSASDIRPGSLL
jgi:hypothetical protein